MIGRKKDVMDAARYCGDNILSLEKNENKQVDLSVEPKKKKFYEKKLDGVFSSYYFSFSYSSVYCWLKQTNLKLKIFGIDQHMQASERGVLYCYRFGYEIQ